MPSVPDIPFPPKDTFDLLSQADGIFREAFPADELPGTWNNQNRKFSAYDYLGAFLLAIYAPVVSTMRGLCEATRIPEFRNQAGLPFINSTSFSDAQHHLEAGCLVPAITKLGSKIKAGECADSDSPASKSPEVSAQDFTAKFLLNVVDSSVFHALPGMLWALFGAGRTRKDGKKTASVRMHVSFDPIAMCLNDCRVTPARVDEKAEWRKIMANLQEGEKTPVEVGDRNFSSNYTLLGQLTEGKIKYVVRFKVGSNIKIEEEFELTEAEKAEGIIRHAWAVVGKIQPGRKKQTKLIRVRLVWLQRGENVILLGTNLEPQDASALVICEMYRHRWQIEFFFYWFKRILKSGGHWLARSQKGASLQLYLAIILTLLLHLQTGQRPSIRQIELLKLYAMGLAAPRDLSALLRELARKAVRDKASARKRYLKAKEAKAAIEAVKKAAIAKNC